MIIDMMRIPTDKYGDPLYDMDEIKNMLDQYAKLFPEHHVFAVPDKIKIWEDLDIDVLQSIRNYLDEVITSKEIEENGL